MDTFFTFYGLMIVAVLSLILSSRILERRALRRNLERRLREIQEDQDP